MFEVEIVNGQISRENAIKCLLWQRKIGQIGSKDIVGGEGEQRDRETERGKFEFEVKN